MSSFIQEFFKLALDVPLRYPSSAKRGFNKAEINFVTFYSI